MSTKKQTFEVSFYDKRRKPTTVEAKTIQEAIEIVYKTITKSGFAVKSKKMSIAVVPADKIIKCQICGKKQDEDGRCGCTNKDAYGI